MSHTHPFVVIAVSPEGEVRIAACGRGETEENVAVMDAIGTSPLDMVKAIHLASDEALLRASILMATATANSFAALFDRTAPKGY